MVVNGVNEALREFLFRMSYDPGKLLLQPCFTELWSRIVDVCSACDAMSQGTNSAIAQIYRSFISQRLLGPLARPVRGARRIR